MFVNTSVQASVCFSDVGGITSWADEFINNRTFVRFWCRVFLGGEGVGFDDIPVVHEFHRSFKQAGNLSGTVSNKKLPFFPMKGSLIQMVCTGLLLSRVGFGVWEVKECINLSDSQRGKPFQEANCLIFGISK